MKELFKVGQNTINFFWLILFSLTVLFAFLSPNLKIGDNAVFGTSTTFWTTGLIIFLVGIIISLFAFPMFRKKMVVVFIHHQLKTAAIFLVVVLLWQIIFIYFVHPENGFDSGMLHYAATNKQHALEANVMGYFSMNQNNLPIMLLMEKIVAITGQTSWEFFDYLTLFLVDLSVLLNVFAVKLIAPKALGYSMYLQGIGLLVFPSILMPYTDTWVMPLVSGYLLCYFLLVSQNVPSFFRIIGGVLFSPLVVLTYFMKPSGIIPVIAIFLVSLLYFITQTHDNKKRKVMLIITGLLFLSGGVMYECVKGKIANQDYIQIDSSRNIPMIHFVSMGIVGDGGYSAEQAEMMAILPTKEEKITYSKEIIIHRLQELNIGSYLSFLVKKQQANTADGTFGWLKEGKFFVENQQPSTEGLTNKLKNFIFLYGENIADFRFVAQLVWLLSLLVIFFGWGKITKEVLILRLSLVGAFLFLLIFEGGRSRYMIQYLPCFVLMGSVSFENTLNRFKKIVIKINGEQTS